MPSSAATSRCLRQAWRLSKWAATPRKSELRCRSFNVAGHAANLLNSATLVNCYL
jgi:hypothetical protein